MGIRRGIGLAFGLAEESTWGTAVSRDTWIRGNSSGLQVDVVKKRRPDLYLSTTGAPIKHYTEKQDAGGTIEVLFGFEGHGKIIKHALWGTPTTTGPSSSLYTHTYPLAADPPTGLTIEEVRGTDASGTNAARVYEGCLIDSVTWELSAGGLLTETLDIIAETAAAESSAGTPSFTTNEIEALHSAAGSLAWNSTNYADIRTMKVSVKRNLARRNRLGSHLTSKPVPGVPEIMMEFEIDTTNADWLTGLTADTESAATITITGSGSRSVAFAVHKAYVHSVSDPIQGPDVITQKVTLIGQWSSTTDRGITVTVINTQSSAIAA